MKAILDFVKAIIPPKYNIKDAYEQKSIPLTQEHLLVIQHLHVAWLNIENGALAVYLPRFDEIAKILKKPKNSNELKKIMSEALCSFPIWFATSSCLPNSYAYKENEVFNLTEHHIELLKLLVWCDMNINDGLVDFFFKGYPLPLPYTDGKRPFGQRVNYEDDIIEFLGEKINAESLFRELDKALYVYLRNTI